MTKMMASLEKSHPEPFSSAVRNPDDDIFEIVESLGFSPFGYDAVALDGA